VSKTELQLHTDLTDCTDFFGKIFYFGFIRDNPSKSDFIRVKMSFGFSCLVPAVPA